MKNSEFDIGLEKKQNQNMSSDRIVCNGQETCRRYRKVM